MVPERMKAEILKVNNSSHINDISLCHKHCIIHGGNNVRRQRLEQEQSR